MANRLFCCLYVCSLLASVVVCGIDTKAPENFSVDFKTSKGEFTIDVTRSWAPLGADRFYTLVTEGFYTDSALFRVIPGFVVQWGINGDPAINSKWKQEKLMDDKPSASISNEYGTISFAAAGKNSRTMQVFINYTDNQFLDEKGFTPFGKVTRGMKLTVELFKSTKENVPNQGLAMSRGSDYLEANFPNLDYIYSATVVV